MFLSSNSFWLEQILDAFLAVAVKQRPLMIPLDGVQTRPVLSFEVGAVLPQAGAVQLPAELEKLVTTHQAFLRSMCTVSVESIVDPLRRLCVGSRTISHRLWVELFPRVWDILSPEQRHDLTKASIDILKNESFLTAQSTQRPNVIQVILEGITHCSPPMRLPPALVKYVSKSYCGWHTAIEYLHTIISRPRSEMDLAMLSMDDEQTTESSWVALGDLYNMLSEDDYFCGLWRRKASFGDTNAALSYEQIGNWSKAQELFLVVQNKARTGSIHYTEAEYNLWQEHSIK